MHRHDLEDSLQVVLDKLHPGTEIDGGGTALGADGEPLSCDIEVEVADSPDRVVGTVVEFLNSVGAPRGSYTTVDGGDPVPFGVTEGLGLYLNGTELPTEVYENADPNELIDSIDRSLGEEGDYVSYWQGPTETALYLYGPSADRMRQLIAGVIAATPLAQRSRLVPLT